MTLRMLGRATTAEEAIRLQRDHRAAFVHLVPLKRGWLVFRWLENHEAVS